MTIPSERTRALILAEALLRELSLKNDVPESVRSKVVGVLRHFPSKNDIEFEAEYQMKTRQDVLKQAWLLPVDYYDRIKKGR